MANLSTLSQFRVKGPNVKRTLILITKSLTSDPYKRGASETRLSVLHFQLSYSGELFVVIAFDEMLHVGP